MTRRSTNDGEDYRPKRRQEAFTDGLFANVPAYDQPIPEPKPASFAELDALGHLMRDMVLLVHSMKMTHPTLTMDDVREIAEEKGILRAKGEGHEYSWMGHLPKLAGLISTGELVRSRLPHSHGHIIRKWRFPNA